ncbi:hypothetical protein IFM89_011939, partial [Coptis chinensis]
NVDFVCVTLNFVFSLSCVKTLTKLPILGWIGFIFRNVKYVELTNQWDGETCICAIANILERLPHIEALALERNKLIQWLHITSIMIHEVKWLRNLIMKECRNKDRISVLPEALFHYVFFFMDMRDVVQTSLLSKRFRYLWLSTPYLNFGSESRECQCPAFYRCTYCIKEWHHFVDFVDRVLLLHGSSNISKFKIYYNLDLEATHVKMWLIATLGRNDEELYIDTFGHDSLDLSHKSFTLKVRELRLSYRQINFPFSTWIVARLKNLELVSVKFTVGNANEELRLNCPVLEILKMRKCSLNHLRNLTVLALILKRLELRSLYCDIDKPCTLKACTSNLNLLRCTVYEYIDYCLEGLLSLDDARIGLYTYAEEGSKYGVERKKFAHCLIKVLSGIYSVKALSISTLSVQEKWSLGSIDEVEQWEAHMPIQTRFPGLKTIEIWESHGAELELKFAKLLLERAIVLKEVIIKTTRTCSMDDKERLTKFNVKLLSLPRASSSIKISFQ